MHHEAYLTPVQSIPPYTHESILENDVAYLFEEQCDWSLDQFDDNDF